MFLLLLFGLVERWWFYLGDWRLAVRWLRHFCGWEIDVYRVAKLDMEYCLAQMDRDVSKVCISLKHHGCSDVCTQMEHDNGPRQKSELRENA